MLFNSWSFLVFFTAVFAVYWALRPATLRVVWLLIASYVFYGWMSPFYLVLIGYSTIVAYVIARLIPSSPRKKWWLALAVVNGLLLLGFFKYVGFFAANVTWLAHHLGSGFAISEKEIVEILVPKIAGALKHIGITFAVKQPKLLLPVGISFYTFIILGYLVDVYRGTVPPEKNFFRFAAFVSCFPYLLAGPLERAKNMLPQLGELKPFTSANITEGLSLFIVGLFKKIALADFLALYVNKVFGDPTGFAGAPSLLATYAFAWQIYFDFSGYTDMARGAAKMLGYDLMLNFNNPYLATGLGDFWRRWHISLSSWIKDYLYIPLGGNRSGRVMTYRNMIIAMLLAGFWHGAAWTFIIWGALHAIGRSATRELEFTAVYRDRVPTIVKQILTFHFVCLTWIFFRAETFGKAMTILKNIFSFPYYYYDPGLPILAIVFVMLVWAYQFAFESRFRRILEMSAVRMVLMLAMIMYLIYFSTPGYEKFIYFRF